LKKAPTRDYASIYSFAQYAFESHGAQMYGGRPYRYHLEQTALTVDEMGGDEDEIKAAYAHDLIEDPKKTHAEIAERSNQRVADIVWAVTGVGDTREEQILSVARKIPQVPGSEKVKLADRLKNMRQCLLEKKWKKLKVYVLEHDILGPVLPSAADNPWRAELDEIVDKARNLLIARGDLPRPETITYTERFATALAALCTARPPMSMCADWICDPDSEELQQWVLTHMRLEWAQGIGLIDAAHQAAQHCEEGRPELTSIEDDQRAYWAARNAKTATPASTL
jgi:hypothetical protein